MHLVPPRNKGTPRNLVDSFRDASGRPTSQFIHYIYLWPPRAVERLIALHVKLKEAEKNAEDLNQTQVFRNKASKLREQWRTNIDSLKRRIDEQVQPSRSKADRRKRSPSLKPHEKNPWNDLTSLASRLESVFKDLESKKPMEQWGERELMTFVREMEPMVKKSSKATELLKRRPQN